MGRLTIYGGDKIYQKRNSKYVVKYVKNHYKPFVIRLRIIEDKDIIDKLLAESNKNEYIKNLIRDDISKNH